MQIAGRLMFVPAVSLVQAAEWRVSDGKCVLVCVGVCGVWVCVQ
jgi:hypothetical protein